MHVLKRLFIQEVTKKQLTRSVSSNAAKSEEHWKPWKEIPGPSSLPFIGQLLHFLPGGTLYNRSMEMQEILYKNYGPIVRLEGYLGLPPITFIYDPEAVWNIFRKEEPKPLRPAFESVLYYLNQYLRKSPDDYFGLVFEDGENWKKLRSAVSPAMLQPETVKLYYNTTCEVADDMVKRIKLIRDKNNALKGDFNTEMNLWSLESIAAIGLGTRLNCLDPNLPEDSPVKKIINNIHGVAFSIDKLDMQPSIWKYFATPKFKKGIEIYSKHMQFIEYYLQKGIEHIADNDKVQDENKGILVKLLEVDHQAAVAMASDMLFAGVDTTSTTAIGLLYLLAKNPEKQNKLREEIMSKSGINPYTKACIKESMRMLPVASGNFRKTTRDYNVLGYKIPKDVNVHYIIAHQFLCMNEEQFPRPTEFIPERWIVDKTNPLYYGNAHPFVYTPFGYGVRSCIGQRVAKLEVGSLVSKIVENFQIGWCGPPLRQKRVASINCFLGPYNFTFKDI